MFGLITFIQMIGNIFFSYKEIDANGELFKAWVELTGPVWEMLGSKATDVIAMKRWLAFLEGGLLPVISLTSLHFFTKYDTGKTDNVEIKEVIIEKEVIKEVPVEVEKFIEKPIVDDNTGEINLPQDELPISEEINFASPEVTVEESPKPNRLSYVKP
jgi:hypothetical protein